jgi:hypothetical protein
MLQEGIVANWFLFEERLSHQFHDDLSKIEYCNSEENYTTQNISSILEHGADRSP